MDKQVKDFNIRLRTIKLRELAVGIVISVILSGIIMGIFPIIYDNDDLYFIVLLSCLLLFFIWELRGTTGITRNFENLFAEKTRNEILYVFAINLLFAFLFTCLVSGLDLLIGFYDPGWVTGFDIDSVKNPKLYIGFDGNTENNKYYARVLQGSCVQQTKNKNGNPSCNAYLIIPVWNRTWLRRHNKRIPVWNVHVHTILKNRQHSRSDECAFHKQSCCNSSGTDSAGQHHLTDALDNPCNNNNTDSNSSSDKIHCSGDRCA